MGNLREWADRLLIPFLFVMMVALSMHRVPAGDRSSMIWSDAEGYYLYLPATFVYGSWQVWDGKDGLAMLSCCLVNDDQQVKTRYTYGVAAMQAPFFLAAHAWALVVQGEGTPPPADWSVEYPDLNTQNIHHRKYSALRGQATGFSDTYGIGIMIATAFYAALGLWFVRKALLRHFGKVVATGTTVLIWGATNLYYYSVVEAGMSHAYSFCLFATLIWLLPMWLERPRLGLSLAIGGCLSLIFLIRPTNILIGLLILFWEVYSFKDLQGRMQLFLSRWTHILAMAGIGLVLVTPQMMYWHHVFGDWLVWSYEGEGFSNALHPKLLQVLFSYQNGLFLYTPIMLLAMIGIVIGWRQRKNSAPATLIVFLLATYVFASWWAWWFGGAFGHRCYVEFYALLAFPLAMIVNWIWENPRIWIKWAGVAMLCGFVYANVKMTLLYAPPWDGPDWTLQSYIAVLKNVVKFWR